MLHHTYVGGSSPSDLSKKLSSALFRLPQMALASADVYPQFTEAWRYRGMQASTQDERRRGGLLSRLMRADIL